MQCCTIILEFLLKQHNQKQTEAESSIELILPTLQFINEGIRAETQDSNMEPGTEAESIEEHHYWIISFYRSSM